jgi:hypothetical protein
MLPICNALDLSNKSLRCIEESLELVSGATSKAPVRGRNAPVKLIDRVCYPVSFPVVCSLCFKKKEKISNRLQLARITTDTPRLCMVSLSPRECLFLSSSFSLRHYYRLSRLGGITEESRESPVVGRKVGRVNVQTSLTTTIKIGVNTSVHERLRKTITKEHEHDKASNLLVESNHPLTTGLLRSKVRRLMGAKFEFIWVRALV